MKYKGENYQMCDAWFLNVNDRIHVFNLKLPDGGKPKNVAHVYTDDLLHYTKCDDILEPFDESVNPDDCNDHGTGCAITNSTNGKHYIYYTMLNMARDQKIGLLTSDDLEHFEYYGEPVLEIDKTLFEEHMQNGTGTDCRDMIIVYDENEKLYYGYFAAMAKSENGPVGAVGVAESRDLIHWGNQSIVYKSRSCGVVEVPDVYELDGKWYLKWGRRAKWGRTFFGTILREDIARYPLFKWK